MSTRAARGFRLRRVASALLVANAVRPVPGYRAGIASFGAGMLVGELAPHVLAGTVADTVNHLRRGGRDGVGLAAAGVGALGLGYLVDRVRRERARVEDAMVHDLGLSAVTDLDPSPDDDVTPADLVMPWRDLVTPFGRRGAERRHHVHVERDVAYAPWGRRGMLDIYTPAAGVTGAPVLLQVHGGAWVTGSKNAQGLPLMRHLASRGWVCVAVNYRLAPRALWPAQAVDVATAVAWVRRNIEAYGGDPRYLAITGGSAGGHLAALAALTPGDPAFRPPPESGFADADTSVQVALPHYGVYDLAGATESRPAVQIRDRFLPRRVFPRSFAEDPETYRAASPLLRITEDAPDFFVVHGSTDTVVGVDQARQFVARLRKVSRREVVYAELPGAQHAFDVVPSLRSATVVGEIDRYLTWHRRRWLAEHGPFRPAAAGDASS